MPAALTFYKKENVKDFIDLVEKVKHIHYVNTTKKLTNDQIAIEILTPALRQYIDSIKN